MLLEQLLQMHDPLGTTYKKKGFNWMVAPLELLALVYFNGTEIYFNIFW